MSAPRKIIARPDARTRMVIEVTTLRGEGVEGDPVREVTTYHDLVDGTLLAERDSALPALARREEVEAHEAHDEAPDYCECSWPATSPRHRAIEDCGVQPCRRPGEHHLFRAREVEP